MALKQTHQKNLTKLLITLSYKAYSRTELMLHFGVTVIQYGMLCYNLMTSCFTTENQLTKLAHCWSHVLNTHMF